uniref:DUF7950 domain-containing protein n=1 Tax=Nicotiana tabacum TaxID=4097 RepID=A0A1S4DHS6_TOBAC|nr:PREDICTED: uncharacterized protein LOC107829869 [Nicotiana tabacum]
MDVGNNWAGSGYPGAPKDMTIINKMMLRFRPIAPKPVANSSGSGSTIETHKIEVVSKRRTKRKYVRVKKNSNYKNKKENREKKEGSLVLDDHGTIVTLQLLPETSGGVKNSPENRSYPKTINFWMNFDKSENNDILSVGAPNLLDQTVEMRSAKVVESWVMVDGITNTLVSLSALGNTDTEKMKNLEADTCPGLISDGLDRVQWVNLAYRRMIDPLEDGGEPPEMVVRLVLKEKKTVPLLLLPAFACTVRVVYTMNNVKQTRTMPCDVWKMDFGGFAWRFDAKAALSLGI